MAVQLNQIPALDPGLFTGPSRIIGGIGRTGNVVTGSYYGPNGSIEFASWLYVSVTGDISYTKWDGTDQVLKALQAGRWHPILSIRVNSSGTTATDIVWGS